jgi:hypothetical protein
MRVSTSRVSACGARAPWHADRSGFGRVLAARVDRIGWNVVPGSGRPPLRMRLGTARHGPPLLRRSHVAADTLRMDAFDHITDSDHSDHDGAERQWPSHRPECSPLPRLSLMDQFDFERELERMLGSYQPPSGDDYSCY